MSRNCPIAGWGTEHAKLDDEVDGVSLIGSCEDGAPATVLLTVVHLAQRKMFMCK